MLPVSGVDCLLFFPDMSVEVVRFKYKDCRAESILHEHRALQPMPRSEPSAQDCQQTPRQESNKKGALGLFLLIYKELQDRDWVCVTMQGLTPA